MSSILLLTVMFLVMKISNKLACYWCDLGVQKPCPLNFVKMLLE